MRLSALLWLTFLLRSTSGGHVPSSRFNEVNEAYIKLLDKAVEGLNDTVVRKTDRLSQADSDRASCIGLLKALHSNLTEPWALSMLDSSAKVQSGFLTGNILSLGVYDECVKITGGPSPANPTLPPFVGQHCLITAKVYFPNGSMYVNGEVLSLNKLFGTSYLPLTIGLCLPSTCKPWVLQEAFNLAIAIPDNVLYHLDKNISVNITVDDNDCHVRGGPPYDLLDYGVLAVILFFVLLGIVSSSLDYYISNYTEQKYNDNSFPMKLLLSFSFYTNSQKLFSCKVIEDSIPSLNGLKFISICWLILGNRYLFLNREPLTNLLDLKNLKDLDIMFIFNAPLSFEAFFVIAGMLNMYGFATMMGKTNSYTFKDLISTYLHRYLRLTPAYLMMIAFTATWQYRLRDGPLWGRFVGEYKDSCRESYWMNLLYLNNYLKPDGFCMSQSWYLAVEMQLFWLSPLIVYPLWRWPRAGLIQLLILTIASIVCPFAVSWYGHIKSPLPITSDHARKVREMSLLFYPTHTKSMSYVLGITAGYVLYKYKQGEINVKFNKWLRTLGWKISASLMMYAVFGGYYTFLLDTEYNRLFSAFFIGFQRFFWSSGLIWIIWMCAMGYGGFVNDFLSWKVFIPLGRVTYCVYLTHITILLCSIAGQRNPFNYKDYHQMEMYFGDIVMCLFSGIFLSLLVEMPMVNIQRLISRRGETTENKETKILETATQQTDNHSHVA